jgi:CheY-like chemotaxis protein
MVDGVLDVNAVPLPLRVLLVEDHPDLAAATAAFLEAEGLDVRTALSGHEGLAIMATFHPQLLLCDMNLPDMSGLDLVRELKSTPSTERPYIVMLTGIAGMDATLLQVDRCMVKPITTEAIATLVHAARLKLNNGM